MVLVNTCKDSLKHSCINVLNLNNKKELMLSEKYLKELENYLKSGNLEEDFEYSSEERRVEILDYLERLMDLAEIADETATRIIFKNTGLGQMFESSAQK